jgi:hypothetical protein
MGRKTGKGTIDRIKIRWKQLLEAIKGVRKPEPEPAPVPVKRRG